MSRVRHRRIRLRPPGSSAWPSCRCRRDKDRYARHRARDSSRGRLSRAPAAARHRRRREIARRRSVSYRSVQRGEDVFDISKMGFLEALDVLGCPLRGREILLEMRRLPSLQPAPPPPAPRTTAGHMSRRPSKAMACIQPNQAMSPSGARRSAWKRVRNSTKCCRGIRPSQVRKVAAPNKGSRTASSMFRVRDRIEQGRGVAIENARDDLRQRLVRCIAQQIVAPRDGGRRRKRSNGLKARGSRRPPMI